MLHRDYITHYSDVIGILIAMASQIIAVPIMCPIVCSSADQRKCCEGNPPITSAFPSPRARCAKMFPFDAVIMNIYHFFRSLVECILSCMLDTGCHNAHFNDSRSLTENNCIFFPECKTVPCWKSDYDSLCWDHKIYFVSPLCPKVNNEINLWS